MYCMITIEEIFKISSLVPLGWNHSLHFSGTANWLAICGEYTYQLMLEKHLKLVMLINFVSLGFLENF